MNVLSVLFAIQLALNVIGVVLVINEADTDSMGMSPRDRDTYVALLKTVVFTALVMSVAIIAVAIVAALLLPNTDSKTQIQRCLRLCCCALAPRCAPVHCFRRLCCDVLLLPRNEGQI